MNGGYVGYSRSKRSAKAISEYEMPLSLITKSVIEEFLEEYEDEFTEEELKELSKCPVGLWKFAAKHLEPTSWHHTSSRFNKTNHYSLYSVSDKLLESKDTLEEEYKEHRDSKKKEGSSVKYGVIKVQVWGGSRKRPRLEGYEEVAGIIVGDWLFYKNNHSINGSIKKYKTTANKVEWLKEYDSYSDLTKNHKEYKNTKKVFSKLISEKC